MATLAELERALVAADAAGNTEDARALAQAIAAQRQPKAAPKMEPRARATDGMSSFDRFRAGVGKSLVDTVTGLAQATVDQGTRVTGIGDAIINSGVGNEGFRRGIQQVNDVWRKPQRYLQDLAAERRAIDEDLTSTPAGFLGNTAGVLAQVVGPGLAARGSGAAATLLPTTVRGNAIQGGLLGYVQPATSEGDRAVNTGLGGAGGLIGAAVPAAAGGALRAVRGVAAPFTQKGAEATAARVVRGFAADPASLATRAPSAVPGVQRTLAEETLDPGIAQLQRTVAAREGAPFDLLRRGNNAARVGAIRGFAGDEADIAAAEAARDLATRPLLRDAMSIEGIDTNRLIGRLGSLARAQEGRPAVQKAINDVTDLLRREIPDAERLKGAAEPLKQFIAKDKSSATNREAAADALKMIRYGDRPAASFVSPPGTSTAASQRAGREALAQSRKAFDRTTTGQDKVSVLYNVRKTINDMLSGKYGGDSAQALAGSRELMAVRNGLDRVLERQAPEFGQYMDAYRSASVPINRMQAGQELLKRGSGSIDDALTGVEQLTPNKFGQQVRNLDQVAVAGTGFHKASAADVFQPSDLATIGNINDDLARQAFTDTAGRGSGSDTFQKLATNGDIIGAVQELGVNIPGSGVIRMLGSAGRDRVNRQLVEILTDPARAQEVLRRASASDRRAIRGVLTAMGGESGAALAVGSSN